MEGYLDYYQGAYGPTIRLGTESLETLMELKSLLEELRRGQRASLTLTDLPGLTVTNLDSLVLRVVEKQPTCVIRRVEGDTTAFLWENTADWWSDEIARIDAMIESGNQPGHQYLSNEAGDDALIELSFREDTH